MSIADVLRQTANAFLRDKYLQGFEFQEDSQLYYNPVTGYYYDQNTALFYHPSTNCYYYYDNQTDNYVYYTRIPCEHIWTDKLAERKAVAMLGESFAAGMTQDEVDVFECLNSLLKVVLQMFGSDIFDYDILNDEISTHIQDERMDYAPCVRIVEKTSGALYIVTITGAKIGTAPDCEIQLSAEQFPRSEYSAVINYDETKQRYFVMIQGREPKVLCNKLKIDADEIVVIDHGDEWQFGKQEFLAHIHYGTNTCGSCEPGLLRNDQVTMSEPNDHPSTGKVSKETLRRRNLRNIKKQYGIFDVSSLLCFMNIFQPFVFYFKFLHKFDILLDGEGQYRCKYQKKERNSLNTNAENKDKSIYANCLAKPLPGKHRFQKAEIFAVDDDQSDTM
uniref:OCRE domain-containing protein n=1 Tax=Elaeophora elaphi TaxID=1147741 RepID=A0A0R3S1A5_9BILA